MSKRFNAQFFILLMHNVFCVKNILILHAFLRATAYML